MREIIITEKNIANVYDKVNRFFNYNSYIKSWHNFDCGFKKHIKPYHGIYHFYQPIKCYYYHSNINKVAWISVTLSISDRFSLCFGDKVSISSNRISIRQHAIISDNEYLYQVFEKIEEREFREHYGSYRY